MRPAVAASTAAPMSINPYGPDLYAANAPCVSFWAKATTSVPFDTTKARTKIGASTPVESRTGPTPYPPRYTLPSGGAVAWVGVMSRFATPTSNDGVLPSISDSVQLAHSASAHRTVATFVRDQPFTSIPTSAIRGPF